MSFLTTAAPAQASPEAGTAVSTPPAAPAATPAVATPTAQSSPPPAAPASVTEPPPAALAPDAVKETAKTPPDSVVPEKYDLKIPEGSVLDPAHLETLSLHAKELGLNQVQAQALLERESGAILAHVAKQQAEHRKQVEQDWPAAVMADRELGGPEFKGKLETAHRALKHYASPEFVRQLVDTGLGNHPEMVRVFYRLGKDIADSSFVRSPQNPPAKKSAAELLYGNAAE